MKQIVHIPLSSIIQMLCTFNFVLNNEKTDINDWQIDTSTQEALKAQEDHLISESHFQPEEPPIHNSSEQEELMLNYVRNGDTEGFIQFTKTMAAVRPGVIATTPIRQYKNMFIVTATLVSRAAMQGGLDTEEAFRMSDSYIQECEMMANIDAILNLQYRMILSFTEKVQALHLISAPSPVIKRVIQYIANHISEPISAASIAEKLYLSRPYLSRRFKEETGISISQYIMQQKIQRAAFLLEHTDRSISAISLYLGFSSSAHFSAAFKKNTGMTPRSYRMHKTDKY
jgi:YSIRK-targeted surface antigen transcriptional regulator